MKNIFITLYFFTAILLTNFAKAELEKGKWNFVKDVNYCYIGSKPTKTEIEKGKKRGPTYILVYRINKSSNAIVQIEAGYPYDQKKNIEVRIDKSLYEFSSENETPETAWTNKDKEVIFAMKKGVVLEVTGISKKGTKTVDTYTLNGFTVAYNIFTKDC